MDIEKARKYFEKQGIAEQLFALRLKKGKGQKKLNRIIKGLLQKGLMLPPGTDYSINSVIKINKRKNKVN